jgi:membrane associated rhomboid family serine protease
MSIRQDITEQFQKQDNALVKIILINVIIYLVDCILWLVSKFSYSTVFDWIYLRQALPGNFQDLLYQPWSIITYAFSHQVPTPLHILFNMLGMYWFGGLIQEYINSRRLTSIFIYGSVMGGLTFLVFYTFVPPFNGTHHAILVGSSGGLFAVIAAAATLIPEYRFHLLFLGPVKIIYIAIFYIFISLLGTAQENPGGNLAHLGGALMGFIYIKSLRSGIDIGRPMISAIDFFERLFSKKKIKLSYRGTNTIELDGFPNQDEIDKILDKISRSGYESLSKEEKQKLFKASQKQ